MTRRSPDARVMVLPPTARFPPLGPPAATQDGRWGRVRALALGQIGARWADAQWIVTTRLLYHLHDPGPQPSRMQGI